MYSAMNIGNKIYCLRKELEITQDEFARQQGVHRNTAWQWENGYVIPSSEKIAHIANKYGKTIDWFFTDSPIINKHKIYSIYDRKTDEIIVSGTVTECAECMKWSINAFYSYIYNCKKGRSKNPKYKIVEEKDDEE